MKNARVELDLEIFRENISVLRKYIGGKKEIMFVIKSDAYGHSLELLARHAWRSGIKWYLVAHVEEAITLRRLLPDAEIVMAGVIDDSDVKAMIENNIIVFVVSKAHGEMIAAAARKQISALRCHIKIDTGMGRLGLIWNNAVADICDLSKVPGLKISGICTHFASAGAEDKSFPDLQVQRFNDVLRMCAEKGITIPFRHASNSAGILRDTTWDYEAVRAGILLYGYCGKNMKRDSERNIETKPFLHWKTRVIQVRKVPAGFHVSYDSTYTTKAETCIGTIDIGYSDGYPRKLSNKGYVLVGGQRRPVIGRVTMNVTTVDLGPETNAKQGDEVVLIGTQGKESLWADEIADWCDTISYEILTGIKSERMEKGFTRKGA